MRYPSQYQTISTALCGFILDHDDAIESNILINAYKKTAERWQKFYKSEYGQNIDRTHLQTSQYMSACAMVFVPIHISSDGGASSHGAIGGNCGGGDCDGGGGCGGEDCDGGGGCGGGGD
ncbi:unnamed protein product [Rotaria sordida]|uniref:Uncharacterized protein n=1 Tax=Rotaria sordida TaxID=392033 RepID=A0A819BF56_9BILA|nr:unnamed protein product [Rotaria sordida]CAF0974638.1 unnamed protein product [Rotaria sordida]CAF3800299.1 unnamed protein product [Rotaria sordida]CAF3884546.1 unnamed protein product [Rotaria sordida]